MVAAIGEQILAPTDVSLSNWTVRPSSGCSVVLAAHRGVLTRKAILMDSGSMKDVPLVSGMRQTREVVGKKELSDGEVLHVMPRRHVAGVACFHL